LLLIQRRMQMLPTPCGNGNQPSPQALLHRAHLHRESPSPASTTPVRKAQKVERRGLVRPPCRICIGSAGLNVHLLPDPFSSETRL
jgi:hypothetical protein